MRCKACNKGLTDMEESYDTRTGTLGDLCTSCNASAIGDIVQLRSPLQAISSSTEAELEVKANKYLDEVDDYDSN